MIKCLIFLLFFPLSALFAEPIIIGTTSENPPFNSLADKKDHFYGFDIDIMDEICHRLKLTCQFTPVVFNNLFIELDTQEINLAMAGIIITPNRANNFLFSLPYLKSKAQFICKFSSTLQAITDLKNKRVGVRRGTPFGDLATKLYNNQITIVEFQDNPDLFNGLGINQVDAVLMDEEAAKYWAADNENQYKLIGSPIPIGKGYAIMASKNERPLINQINQALLDMSIDGSYSKIYDRYF